MYLLVGLGNPGTKYYYNRHNIGYMVIDHLAKNYELPSFKKKTKSSYRLQTGDLVEIYDISRLKPTDDKKIIKYLPKKKNYSYNYG